MEQFDYEQLVKATKSFSPSNLLGKGSHGSVYKGVLLQENKLVAVKRSTIGIDQVSYNDNYKKLDNELLVLSSLRKNPYIVNFFGMSCDHVSEKNKLLVMEYMPNGSLHDLLHASTTPPPWPKRLEIAIQVAKALQFLHEGKPLVIHRDVKSANVLFDSDWNAKLADYGLAVLRVESPSHQPSQQPAGTIGYLDPCYTIPSKLSTRNDIFSYGVVLLEIISGRKVIDVLKSPASIVEWAVPLITKQRSTLIHEVCDSRIALPSFMEGTIKQMLKMAARCVSSKEEKRPSIGEIVAAMGSYCLIERVKLVPSWLSLMKTMVLIRRRPKLAKQCQIKCASQKLDVHSDITKGKILFREILLAEIRLR